MPLRPQPIVALACAGLLALPPGWCCAATGGACCGVRPRSEAPAPACPKCPDCCSEPPAPAPADPPPRAPARKAACCERPAGIVERTDRPADPAIAFVPAPTADRPAAAPAVVGDLSPVPAALPFRVLHCVWLC